MNKIMEEFEKALNAIDNRQKVTCTVGDGEPIIYQAINNELTINGKRYDIRDFCFSPTQILFGKWTIEDGESKC